MTTGPSAAATTPVTSGVTGMLVDGVSNARVAGATIRVDGLGETTSAADGTFGLTAEAPAQVRRVTIDSASTIERVTGLRAPGLSTTLSLMPATLGLDAFNQMFRGNGAVLHRWVAQPRVIIQRRTLRFTGTGDNEFVATETAMSASEAEALFSDLTWALPQFTANTFTAFADKDHAFELANEGDTVNVNRPGIIVVARYEGLSQATPYWGYTRWAWNPTGEMMQGIVMLDRNFETSGSQYRRSLRAHELGHAMGYNHVTLRASVMASAATTEPNDADRGGARVAFQRPVLNRSPDTDPDPFTINRVGGGVTWASDY